MEHRPGLEPGKTGFAIPRFDHFSIRCKLCWRGIRDSNSVMPGLSPALFQSSLSPVVRSVGFEPTLT